MIYLANNNEIGKAVANLICAAVTAVLAPQQRLNEGNPSIRKNIQEYKEVGNAAKNLYGEIKKK